jgi:hypothetical protein
MNRNKLYIAAVLAFAGLVVTPALEVSNYSKKVNIAEGSPLPAPVPRPPGKRVMVAEGSPLPAPVPRPSGNRTVLLAEGSPLPAPVPRPPLFTA